jgi:hypothetical protein
VDFIEARVKYGESKLEEHGKMLNTMDRAAAEGNGR